MCYSKCNRAGQLQGTKQYGKMNLSDDRITSSSSTNIEWNIIVSDNIQTDASRVSPEHLCFPKWIQVKRIFIAPDPNNPSVLKIFKI